MNGISDNFPKFDVWRRDYYNVQKVESSSSVSESSISEEDYDEKSFLRAILWQIGLPQDEEDVVWRIFKSDGFEKAFALLKESDLKSCTKLNLAGLGIQTLPDKVKELCNLEELILKKNKLYSLPDLSYLTQLEELDLSANEFSSFPSQIEKLGLKFLWLGKNKITQIPESFFEFSSNLEQLSLAENGLDCFPEAILDLKNLEVLNLNGNKISSIPGGIGDLWSLKEIMISDNSLIELPWDLLKLKLLRHLNISKNKFSQRPDLLYSLPKTVKILDDFRKNKKPPSKRQKIFRPIPIRKDSSMRKEYYHPPLGFYPLLRRKGDDLIGGGREPYLPHKEANRKRTWSVVSSQEKSPSNPKRQRIDDVSWCVAEILSTLKTDPMQWLI